MSFFSNLFGGPQISPASEITEQLQAGALIVDVRTAQEFAQGKIAGAINIPVQVIAKRIDEISKHNKNVIVYCRSGARATTAMNILNQAGLKAFNAGGIMDFQRLF